MEEIISVIGNVGFPIATAGYLLIRMEQKLELLSASINNLSRHIENMS